LEEEKPGKMHLRLASPGFWAALALGALVLWGSFYNLANYPTIWWDEGIFSETAANLVQHGRYAFTVESPDQLHDLDFRISVGPMVILPVALAYKVFGVGVASGRLVAGAYLVLAFLALFLGARRLFGPGAALLAVALPFLGTEVLYWGRSVLGDIPALGLFLFGLWFLVKGLDDDEVFPWFWGGIFLGLAFDAKEFYGLAFLPPIFLLARQHWRRWRRLAARLMVFMAGAALPLLAYLLIKALILGGLEAAVLHFLLQKKLLCHEFFTPFTIGRVYPESFTYLLEHPLFWLGGLGAWWTWKKGNFSLGKKLWVWNFLIWSLVYLTAVYWQRFALPALFLASPLAAGFLFQAQARLVSPAHPRACRWLGAGLLAGFFILVYPLSGLDVMNQIYQRQADVPSRLVDYLRKHVPVNCLIETPEYELAFLDDDHRIHLMPSYYFVESTPDRIVLLNPRPKPYDFEGVKADFLILGSFGKSVFKQIYPQVRVARDWRRIAQVEYYDIYISRKCRRKVLEFIKRSLASARRPNSSRPAAKINAPQKMLN
jgi:4-amino-4-deoxy-L-arabinose transferase-like glycosyltransferase